MHNLKRTGIIGLVLVCLLGLAPAAPAACPGPRGTAWKGGGPHPLAALGLSDQQLARVKEMERTTYRQTRKLAIKMMDTRFALSQLKLQKNVDQAAVAAKAKELQDLRIQMQNCHKNARKELQSILTPEQWAKLKDTVEKGRQHRPGPGGPGGPAPAPPG